MTSAVDLAVIPVAGLGTRLLPATKSQPKEMLPVGSRPVVQFVVEEAAASGIRRVLFVTGPGKASIENHFDIDAELVANLRETGREELLRELEFERQGLEYFYTRQRRQLGLGHAVLCARAFVGDQPFVVALGDSIVGLETRSRVIARLIEEFHRTGADAVVAFEEVAQRYPPREYAFFVAISYSKLNAVRREKYQAAKILGYRLASYVSSRATVLNDGRIGENCFILEDNTIQPFVTIGHNVTFWSGNHVGHRSQGDARTVGRADESRADHVDVVSSLLIEPHHQVEDPLPFEHLRDGASLQGCF